MSPRSNFADQNLVFVSYSHVDVRWLERLRVHLKPLERRGVLELWDDTKIKPGARWRDAIRDALEHARVAVLLVTADFLASDFISTNELPPLLKAAEERGTLILPVIVKHCRFEQTEGLSHFQAVNPPSKPIAALRSTRREEAFWKLSGVIEEALRTTSAVDKQPTISRPSSTTPSRKESQSVREVESGPYTIRQLDSGSIEVERDGRYVKPTKPALREIASRLNIGLRNRNGNPLNTRQLGRLIIERLEVLGSNR